MTATASPIESASQLRAECRERTQQGVEAMLRRLGPHLVGLDADSLAVILSAELSRVVESAQDEALHELAALATQG
jgi:hypothetical protein